MVITWLWHIAREYKKEHKLQCMHICLYLHVAVLFINELNFFYIPCISEITSQTFLVSEFFSQQEKCKSIVGFDRLERDS